MRGSRLRLCRSASPIAGLPCARCCWVRGSALGSLRPPANVASCRRQGIRKTKQNPNPYLYQSVGLLAAEMGLPEEARKWFLRGTRSLQAPRRPRPAAPARLSGAQPVPGQNRPKLPPACVSTWSVAVAIKMPAHIIITVAKLKAGV